MDASQWQFQLRSDPIPKVKSMVKSSNQRSTRSSPKKSVNRSNTFSSPKKSSPPSTPVSSSVGHLVSSSASGESARIADLCDDDKAKIAKLIRQLVKVGKEKESYQERAKQQQQEYESKLQLLKLQHDKLINDTTSVRQKFGHTLRLLRMYQQKLADLQSTNGPNTATTTKEDIMIQQLQNEVARLYELVQQRQDVDAQSNASNTRTGEHSDVVAHFSIPGPNGVLPSQPPSPEDNSTVAASHQSSTTLAPPESDPSPHHPETVLHVAHARQVHAASAQQLHSTNTQQLHSTNSQGLQHALRQELEESKQRLHDMLNEEQPPHNQARHSIKVSNQRQLLKHLESQLHDVTSTEAPGANTIPDDPPGPNPSLAEPETILNFSTRSGASHGEPIVLKVSGPLSQQGPSSQRHPDMQWLDQDVQQTLDQPPRPPTHLSRHEDDLVLEEFLCSQRRSRESRMDLPNKGSGRFNPKKKTNARPKRAATNKGGKKGTRTRQANRGTVELSHSIRSISLASDSLNGSVDLFASFDLGGSRLARTNMPSEPRDSRNTFEMSLFDLVDEMEQSQGPGNT